MAKSKGKGGSTLVPITINTTISPAQSEELLATLQARFEENMNRHGIDGGLIGRMCKPS